MDLHFVDIGINLAHDSFDADRPAVVARACEAGVTRMVVTGSTLASSRRALELAAAWPGVLWATAGVHPHHATELLPADRPELVDLLADPGCVAAGECGLDYFRNYSPHDAQERAFRLQIEVAIEARKPLFLHQRDAHDDFVRILSDYGRDLPPAVAHCFTGTADEVAVYLAMGLHVGITGWICDERRGRHLVELVGAIPAERLMIETDGPYLLPRDLRPKPASRRNEPAFLPHVAAAVARARGEPIERLAAATSAAAERFFGLAPARAATVDTRGKSLVTC
jgi:TatD DNase family protein